MSNVQCPRSKVQGPWTSSHSPLPPLTSPKPPHRIASTHITINLALISPLQNPQNATPDTNPSRLLPPPVHTPPKHPLPLPPESTTAILILFHGLGDSETPFASFARNINLPGVLAISVRGTAPLPPSLIDDDASGAHFHWGDDIILDQGTGELDPDPGFKRACDKVMRELVRGVLMDKCGWEKGDVLLFGFGQGGSLALGMAAQEGPFKGVVSIGGGVPRSMLLSGRGKSDTHVLACQVDGREEGLLKGEFANVQVVRWKGGVRMPKDREEVLPLMRFFAERLRSWSA